MSPELSRRIGRALARHWVTFDERDLIIGAIDTAQNWSDLSPDVRTLVEDIESRPLVTGGPPK